MSTAMVKGLVAGAVIATAGGVFAGYNMMEPQAPPPEFAEVLNVQPAIEQIAQSKEVCEDVEMTHQAEPRDKHRVAGTATGAVIGGLLGSQVGGGDGKKVATVLGAVAGGIAGNKIQERRQANDTYTTVETRCDMVTEYVDTVVGYDVTYRIGQEQGEIRMDNEPGTTIPLVNGELSLGREASS